MTKKSNDKKPKNIRIPKRLMYYSYEFRGPSQNRHGGKKTENLRTFGGKFGGANKGRHLTALEIAQWIAAHDKD